MIMKKHLSLTNLLLLLIALPLLCLAAFSYKQPQDQGYIIDHEKDIKKEEPGSHNGGGNTTAFSFFSKDKTVQMAFRKRILHPGSSIGYHLQKEQEIYYILSGNGILRMNDKDIPVTTGDGILTKPGSSHGLKPAGNEDLTVLITYDLKQ
jgi:mannose-6-phosphate isomerase-like protein (cupin superfamily)